MSREVLKLEDLAVGDIIIFKTEYMGEEVIVDGFISYINKEYKTAGVNYLYGLKSESDTISFDNIIAYPDKKKGTYQEIGGFSGYFINFNKNKN